RGSARWQGAARMRSRRGGADERIQAGRGAGRRAARSPVGPAVHNGAMATPAPVLPASFSAATTAWFAESFDAPTPAQTAAWEAIDRGQDTLVIAPTGSGKTLAAFLTAIDRSAGSP